MKLGLALLRMIVGTLFMGHGLQKLAGWFGGYGLTGTGQFFEALGLRPGKVQAAASGAAETVGGALLAGGLLTPLGASMISGSMLTAIRKVHAKNGVWVANNGFEYNLVLLGVAFAVTDLGPGSWSPDEALGIARRGPAWALAQLAAGAAGSAAAVALGERQGGEAPDSAPAAQASNGAGAEEADARQAMASANP